MQHRLQKCLTDANLKSPVQNSAHRDNREVKVATAALLVEVARADFEEDPVEKEAVRNLLKSHFNLESEELAPLFERASTAVDEAMTLHPFARTLRDALHVEEREAVLELMWRVVYADGVKDDNEECLVMKVAELLCVPQHQFDAARERVEKDL